MANLVKFDAKLAPLVKELLTESPPGHLCDVLRSVRQLVQIPLPDELVHYASSEHNERNLKPVELPAPIGGVGIICETGLLGRWAKKAVPYAEPRSGKVFLYDQDAGVCTTVVDKIEQHDLAAEIDSLDLTLAEPYRQALDAEIKRYVTQCFPTKSEGAFQGCSGISGGAVYINAGKEAADDDVELRIMLSSRRARPRGHWTGHWSSQWRTHFVPGQGQPASIGGIIEFKSTYVEDGNVHLARKQVQKGEVIQTKDPAKWAKETIEVIARLEDAFEAETEDACANIGANSLKSLRRQLPLSSEKFDWRPVRHAIVKDLKASDMKVEHN